MHRLSVETIVARYMSEAIKAIEQKHCDYCGVGNWRVVTLCVDGKDFSPKGFMVMCAVQCNECQSLDSRNWRFNPFHKIDIGVNQNEAK